MITTNNNNKRKSSSLLSWPKKKRRTSNRTILFVVFLNVFFVLLLLLIWCRLLLLQNNRNNKDGTDVGVPSSSSLSLLPLVSETKPTKPTEAIEATDAKVKAKVTATAKATVDNSNFEVVTTKKLKEKEEKLVNKKAKDEEKKKKKLVISDHDHDHYHEQRAANYSDSSRRGPGGASASPLIAAAAEDSSSSLSENKEQKKKKKKKGKTTTTKTTTTTTTHDHDYKVTLAHQPRNDLLGSFVLPTILMNAIANQYGENWNIEILPYLNSKGYQQLKSNIEKGPNINPNWGSGVQDASYRNGYDPIKLNAMAYETFGFFPPENKYNSSSSANGNDNWIEIEGKLPPPNSPELEKLCGGGNNRNHAAKSNNSNTLQHRCKLWLPNIKNKQGTADTYVFQNHITENGGMDKFFPPQYRNECYRKFMTRNRHRLQYYNESTSSSSSSSFHIAMHVRRGDITAPWRWIKQSAYAKIGRQICQEVKDHNNTNTANTKVTTTTHVHVFSSGRNRDGDWLELERGLLEEGSCDRVTFHLDGNEYVTLTHFVEADALIMSKSSFSYVPALFAKGDVYFPESYKSVKPLKHWKPYQDQQQQQQQY